MDSVRKNGKNGFTFHSTWINLDTFLLLSETMENKCCVTLLVSESNCFLFLQ